jgi:hypothetical protein
MDWNYAVYGACSLGRRHFWAAWHSAHAWYDGERPFASGYTTTREHAEEHGRAAIRALVTDCDAQRLSVGSVAHYHHRLAVEKRMQRPATSQETAPLEFLYRFSTPDQGQDSVWLHRIVKKTARRVFVEERCRKCPIDTTCHTSASEEKQTKWYAFDVETAGTDRATLECDGKAWCPGLRDYLYASPALPQSSYTPACLEALGLRVPCTAADVKQAFRVLSKETHPDTGGDAQRFIALQGAYEQSLVYVQRGSAA